MTEICEKQGEINRKQAKSIKNTPKSHKNQGNQTYQGEINLN